MTKRQTAGTQTHHLFAYTHLSQVMPKERTDAATFDHGHMLLWKDFAYCINGSYIGLNMWPKCQTCMTLMLEACRRWSYRPDKAVWGNICPNSSKDKSSKRHFLPFPQHSGHNEPFPSKILKVHSNIWPKQPFTLNSWMMQRQHLLTRMPLSQF